MPRKNRPLDRDAGVVRDATLVVIASEDEKAVRDYFSRFRTRRVQFRVLYTNDGRSSPKDVLERLDAERQNIDFSEGDEFWVCIDTDHWVQPNHIANLREVVQLCKQKGYRFAICDPCFEFWLLLHFIDSNGHGLPSCADVLGALKTAANGYHKGSVPNLAITAEMVHLAFARAKKLDVDDSEIPLRPTARIYRIIDSLLQRDAIELT